MKPHLKLTDITRWVAAFDSLSQDQQVLLNGLPYVVHWKHEDPRWIQLKGGRERLIVRLGDPAIFGIQPRGESHSAVTHNMEGIR